MSATRPLALALLLALAAVSPARAEPSLRAAPHVAEGGEDTRRLHLLVDGVATFGIGGQMAVGGLARATGYLAVWNTRRATGTLDLGVALAYQNEPVGLAPWLAGKDVTGAGHRVHALLSLGHTVHLGRRRRSALGLALVGGLSHWISSYALVYPTEGVRGRDTVRHTDPLIGGELRYGYRFSERVGLVLVAGAPFPTQSSYVIGMFHVGLGLTVHLR
jgi:hypothetical protein